MNNKRIFIATKPSQYITARNLASQLEGNNNILLLVGNFAQSKVLFNRIVKTDQSWKEVLYFNCRATAVISKLFLFGPNVDLYTDSDIYKDSILNFLSTFFGNVFVYDEGFYSYINNLDKHLEKEKKKIRQVIYKVLKLPNSHGKGCKTRGVYLYNPEFKSQPEKQVQLLRIKTGFYNYISSNIIFFNSLFSYIPPQSFKKEIAIYCSSHDLIAACDFLKKNAVDYVKLHPNINSDQVVHMLNLDKNIFLSSDIPIELVVSNFLSDLQERHITLYHEGSSAILNMADLINKGAIKEKKTIMYVQDFSEEFNHLKKQLII